jgi:hypothetical protein
MEFLHVGLARMRLFLGTAFGLIALAGSTEAANRSVSADESRAAHGPGRLPRFITPFPFSAMTATLDYQFVVNPAYNRDRGPVSSSAPNCTTSF